MVSIPGGKFPMGSPIGEGEADEHPMHVVELTAYKIDQYEVTAAQYQDCMDDGVCDSPGNYAKCTVGISDLKDHPANCVTWAQAATYCAWAGKELPTEAQWERAANGPGGNGKSWRRFPWSSQCSVDGVISEWEAIACPQADCTPEFDNSGQWAAVCTGETWTPGTAAANCPDTQCYDGFPATAPVGSFPSGTSAEGIHDLSGNVWEIVADLYDANFYKNPAATETDPSPTAAEGYRLMRGGSFNAPGESMRAARRGFNYYGDRTGFRCARSSDQ